MAIEFSNDVDVIDIVVPGETQVLTVEVSGMQGPPGALTVGNVITGDPGTSAAINVRTLADGTQVADFTIPRGNLGPANTLTIGTVAPGATAAATITGTSPSQTLNLTLPKGDKGDKGDTGSTGPANTLTIGTVNTLAPGSQAAVSVTGTSPNQTLHLSIPQGATGLKGDTGNTGPANTLAIGTVSTGTSGSVANATITGTSPNQTLNLTLPRGDQGIQGIQGVKGDKGDTGTAGAAGPANTLTIGSVGTGAPGSSASATVTGVSPNQTLNLVIPQGPKGDQGIQGIQGLKGDKGDKGDQGDTGPAGQGIAIAGSVATYADLPTTLTSADAGKGYLVDFDGKLYIWSGTSFPPNGQGTAFQGPAGPANTLSVSSTTTSVPGTNATVAVSGTAPNQSLAFTIPRGAVGATGPANTLTIGTITTGTAGSAADASITGTAPSQTLNLTIPQGLRGLQGLKGDTGATGPANTLAIGTVTTAAAGSNAGATITGTSPNQTLSLTIPQGQQGIQGIQGVKGDTGLKGDTGDAGPANTLSIGTVSTGAPGTSASAVITGTSPNQTLTLTIPAGAKGDQGDIGDTGPANSLAIGTVTTVTSDVPASATITGTAPNQTLSLSIPRGEQGPQGAGAPDATATAKGSIKLAGDLAGTADLPTVPALANKANAAHTHVSTDITDAKPFGRTLLGSADADSARTLIGAGTSSLVIGTAAGTAAAGNDPRLNDARTPVDHQHASTDISDSTFVGRDLIAATDAAAARATIGAGTSSLVIGTTSTTAMRGDRTFTAAEVGAATPAYVDSSDENGRAYTRSFAATDLVANGTAYLGDNTNFSSFALDPTDSPVGGGSFDAPSQSGLTLFNDELMPIDLNRKYQLTASVKQKNPAVTDSRFYLGIAAYDADGLAIMASFYMHYPNTTTTFAADLKPGDTVISLTSAANWHNAAGTSTHLRRFIPWNYVDGKGKAWPTGTYSRNVSTHDLWADGAVDYTANTITLRAAWNGATIPAGTPVSNGSSGGTYMYIAAGGGSMPNEWTRFTGLIRGQHASPTAPATSSFPPGTAFAKLLFLPNYNMGTAAANSRQSYAALSFTETQAAQTDLDNATASAVANTLVRRSAEGVINASAVGIANAPTTDSSATRKDYVDNIGDASATPNTIVRRNSVGGSSFVELTASNAIYISQSSNQPNSATRKDYVDAQVATRAATSHTHTAANISDSTAVGRSVIIAADAAAARTAIGAGTSNLVIGTTASTAMAGNKTFTAAEVGAAPASHTHTAANISDASTVGRSVLTAADAAAARTAIGAGTGNSNLVIGTTAGTAKAGDYSPPADAVATTASMRTLGTGAQQAVAGNDARLSNARTPLAHVHPVTDISATGTRTSSTFLRGDGTWAEVQSGITSVSSTDITDSTAIGRTVITSVDAAAARGAIGAGTSSLTIGTAAGTAAAGNDSRLSDARTPLAHTHTAAQISDSTITGRSLITAIDAAAARSAIGAGTGNSNLVIGTTAGTAAAGNDTRLSDARTPTAHTHTAANISDSTTTGRAVLMAADAATARTAIGAGTSNLVIGTTAATAKAGDYAPPVATESVSGTITIATQAEVTTGTDNTKAVTPLKLRAQLGSATIDYIATINGALA